jgi:hypothetical protein
MIVADPVNPACVGGVNATVTLQIEPPASWPAVAQSPDEAAGRVKGALALNPDKLSG